MCLDFREKSIKFSNNFAKIGKYFCVRGPLHRCPTRGSCNNPIRGRLCIPRKIPVAALARGIPRKTFNNTVQNNLPNRN